VSEPGPPRTAERLLTRCLPPGGIGEGILGDLHELHARKVADPRVGPLRAGIWYWAHALRLSARYALRRPTPLRGGGAGRYPDPRTGRDLSTRLHATRLVARRLVRSPGFTLVAVVTLGVGLGANAAIFSLVDAVLLTPLPFPAAHRLVSLRHAAPGLGMDDFWQSVGSFLTYRQGAPSLEDAGLYVQRDVTLAGEGTSERLPASSVTASFFSTLQVPALLGRVFREDETRPGGPDVVVLGHDLWTRRFGGDPGVVGQTAIIDGLSREVIGVMPEGFRIPGAPTELWLPMPLDPATPDATSFSYMAVARLRPGASLEAVDRDLDRLLHSLPEVYPGSLTRTMIEQAGMRAFARPLRADAVGSLEQVLWLLFGGMGIVLVIACANVANLVLVRAAGRRQEIAVRTALGAGRAAIVREFLGEGLALGALAGLLGAALAWVADQGLAAYVPGDLHRLGNVHISFTVLAYTAMIAVLAGVSFGLLPVSRRDRRPIRLALEEGGRGGTAARRLQRGRNGLVVGQVALALVLLVGSGLLIRTIRAIRRVDPGFSTRGVLTFRLALPEAEYPDAGSVADLYSRVVDGIEGLPGVVTAGAVSERPLVDGPGSQIGTYIEGHVPAPDELPPMILSRFARDDYFEAMGVSLLRGRAFERRDALAWTGAAVVSRSMADRFWPGTDPVGRHLAPYREPGVAPEPTFTVVGVVDDIQELSLTSVRAPVVYYSTRLPDAEELATDTRTMALAVRVSGDPETMIAPVRATLHEIDPGLPVFAPRTTGQMVSDGMAVVSFTLALLAVAAGVALLLGTVGMFGVIAWIVSQRANEIGVRMALGAGRSQVHRMVLRQGLALGGLGVALGVAGAVFLSRFLGTILFGVSATDPLTYAAVSLLLLAVTVLAAWIPAWRASGVPPSRALRGS
jgi:putative ABC transport system permease protein